MTCFERQSLSNATNVAMTSGIFEVLRALSPRLSGSRQLCICSSSVLHPVISHFSAVFSVSWLLLFTHCPSLCTYLLSEGPRAAPAIQRTDADVEQLVQIGALMQSLAQRGFRPSFLQVSSLGSGGELRVQKSDFLDIEIQLASLQLGLASLGH